MPFNSSTTVSPDPDVTIYFEGLVLLYPVDDGRVKGCNALAVNNPTHQLYVDVSVGQPGSSLPFLRIGDKVRTSSLLISKAAPDGVSKYAGPRTAGVDPLETAVDFQRLHAGATYWLGGGHPGVIKLRDGVLYVSKFKGPACIKNSAGCKDYPVIGTQLGARIDFDPANKLKLEWEPGPDGSVELPRDEDVQEFGPHPKYTIWISNSDPIPPLPRDIDFPLLYGGISPVPDPCSLSLTTCALGPAEAGAEGSHYIYTTTRVPCIPGVIGG